MNWKIKVFIGLLILGSVGYKMLVFHGEGKEEERGRGIVLLCAGGSITAAGYPEFLQRELELSGKEVSVLNMGVDGYDPGQYLRYMKSVSLLEETDPDIVLFEPGDLGIRGGRTDLDAFLSNMNEIVTLIESYVNSRGRKPVLLLGTIPAVAAEGQPLRPDYGRIVLEEINPAIVEVAKKHRIQFVDNYQLFIDCLRHGLGLKFHEEGAKLLAENWFKVVLPVVDAAYGVKPTQLRGLSGKIVFQSDRDGQWEIYVINANGSGLARLTQNKWDDGYPAWSPDGREIVFKSNRDGNWEIYKMNADGSDQVRLTHSDAEDEDPSWSPDGETIAFHSFRDGNLEIYVMYADGTNPVRITNSPHKDILPVWSPDGTKISFTSNRIFGWQICVMDADGANMKRLTSRRDSTYSDWSPDGAKLVYVLSQAGRKTDIRVVNVDGTGAENLTAALTDYSFCPRWSPDGKRIVFSRTPDTETENWDIWIMNTDGTSDVQVTYDPGQDKFGDWFFPLRD